MGVCNLIRRQLKNIKDSAVSDYILQCNCTIDFGQTDVLATDVKIFEEIKQKD